MPDFRAIAADVSAPVRAREGAAIALGVQAARDGVRTCDLTDPALCDAWRRGWAIGNGQHAERGTYASRVAEAMDRESAA